MFFVWGVRLFGRVDEVPGLFHVATKFGHFNALPIWPLQTYIVTWKHGERFQGIPIPTSVKSVVMAWVRAVSLLFGFVGLCVGGAWLADGDPRWPPFLIAGVVGGAIFSLAMWHPAFTRASYARAMELCRIARVDDWRIEQLRREYYADAGPVPAATEAGGGRRRGTGVPKPPTVDFGRADLPPVGGQQQQSSPGPAPAAPATPGQPATYFINGWDGQSGQEVCYTVWATSEDQARAIAEGRGTVVGSVENAGGPR